MYRNYNLTLLEYMRMYKCDNNLYYQEAGINQMTFVRDNISNYLLNTPVFVVNTHRSKSVELPVYAMRLLNGIKVIMRDNFYGWVISIISSKPISIPKDLVIYNDLHKLSPYHCDGFNDEWVFEYNIENFTSTTVRINDKFRLFTLLYLLNKEILPDTDKVDKTAISGLNKSTCETIITTYTQRHQYIKDFNELFTSTYEKMTDYDFCQENNLGVFTYDLEDICNRIIKYPEIGEMFLKEKLSFDWGENFNKN